MDWALRSDRENPSRRVPRSSAWPSTRTRRTSGCATRSRASSVITGMKRAGTCTRLFTEVHPLPQANLVALQGDGLLRLGGGVGAAVFVFEAVGRLGLPRGAAVFGVGEVSWSSSRVGAAVFVLEAVVVFHHVDALVELVGHAVVVAVFVVAEADGHQRAAAGPRGRRGIDGKRQPEGDVPRVLRGGLVVGLVDVRIPQHGPEVEVPRDGNLPPHADVEARAPVETRDGQARLGVDEEPALGAHRTRGEAQPEHVVVVDRRGPLRRREDALHSRQLQPYGAAQEEVEAPRGQHAEVVGVPIGRGDDGARGQLGVERDATREGDGRALSRRCEGSGQGEGAREEEGGGAGGHPGGAWECPRLRPAMHVCCGAIRTRGRCPRRAGSP
jgi:hypothetical protein